MSANNYTVEVLCKIYRSARKPGAYLYVKLEEDLEKVPAALLAQLGDLTEVMTLALHAQRKLANADVGKVISELANAGFYLQMPPAEPRQANHSGD